MIRTNSKSDHIYVITLSLILVFAFSALKVKAESFDGEIKKIIDGDSFIIDAVEIRLYGIDAPEFKQFCPAGLKPFPCGNDAYKHFSKRFYNSEVRCVVKAIDIYERTISTCYEISSSLDLADYMVTNGWAFSMSHKYKQSMKTAKAKCLGIWEYGQPIKPRKWRQERKISQAKKLSSYKKDLGTSRKCIPQQAR